MSTDGELFRDVMDPSMGRPCSVVRAGSRPHPVEETTIELAGLDGTLAVLRSVKKTFFLEIEPRVVHYEVAAPSR